MALSPSTLTDRPGAPIAALAIVALMLTVIMGGWRASELMSTGGAADHASAIEISLLQIIEPIVGAGNARISVNPSATGGRTVLVLLDAGASDVAPAQLATVERLVRTAMGISEVSADRMLVEYAEFAPGLPGRLTPANYGELLGFVGLAGLLSWMALASRTQRVAEVTIQRDTAPIDGLSAPAPTVRPVAPKALPPVEAVEMVRRDPTRAAEVLRGWMSGKEDAA